MKSKEELYIYQKNWALKNKEHLKQYQNDYRLKNLEKLREISKKYNKGHPFEINKSNRKWRKKNQNKIKEYNKKWANTHKDYLKEKRKKDHKRDYIKKLNLKIEKAGRNKPENCEICNRGGRICFDHNHKTGKFRGWICYRCNLALGLLDDNKTLLLNMINYLK